MPLDCTKLVNGRPSSNGSKTYGCPACMENGRDHTRDHLVVYPDGKFGCLAFSGAEGEEHRKRIWALAGDGSPSENSESTPQIAPQIEIERVWDDSVLTRLVKDYSYWEGRGIRRETIEPFRGGIATAGQMAGRWVIPIFNREEQIVGFTGRAIRPGMTPPWKHLGKKSTWVWGGLEEIEVTKQAILVESVGDSLALRQAGVPQNLVLFGATISEAILGYLISVNPDRIIVATNKDVKHEVGQMAAEKIQRTLRKFFNEEKVEIALPQVPDLKDFGEMSESQIIEWKNSLDL